MRRGGTQKQLENMHKTHTGEKKTQHETKTNRDRFKTNTETIGDTNRQK